LEYTVDFRIHDDRVVFPTGYLAALAARVVACMDGGWRFSRVETRGLTTLTVDCRSDSEPRQFVCSINMSDVGHAYIPAVFEARHYGDRAIPRPVIQFSRDDTVRLRASRMAFMTGMRVVAPARLPVNHIFEERVELANRAEKLELDDFFQFVTPTGALHTAFSASNLPVALKTH
jgi:hypothetical protein